MSQLGDIIQEWADRQQVQPVSDAAVGRALGTTRQTVGNWRAGLSRMPEPHQLRKLATLTGRPYSEVLEAALVDTGYLTRESLREGGDSRVEAGSGGPQRARVGEVVLPGKSRKESSSEAQVTKSQGS